MKHELIAMNLVKDDIELIESILKTNEFQKRYPTLSKVLSSAVIESEKISVGVNPKEETTEREALASQATKLIPQQTPNIENDVLEENHVIGNQDPKSLDALEFRAFHDNNNNQFSINENDYPENVHFNAKLNDNEKRAEADVPPTFQYYMQRLQEIQSAYSEILQKRNTVKYFHETLRETSRFQAQGPHSMLYSGKSKAPKSRLARYASIHRPTASLCEIEDVQPQPLVLGAVNDNQDSLAHIAFSFNTQMKSDIVRRQLENVLEKEEEDLMVKGVQKLPKPNPAWLLHKGACDISLSHLTEFAKRLRDEIQDMERRWTVAQCNQAIDEFNVIGVDKRLANLYRTQEFLCLEQQKERDNLRQSASLCNAEMNSFLYHTRNEYYAQLYAMREAPEVLDEMKKRTIETSKAAEELIGLQDHLIWDSTRSDIKRKLKNSGIHLKLGHSISPPSSAEKTTVLRKFGFSSKPIKVQDFQNVKTCFPGAFPKVSYSGTVKYPRRIDAQFLNRCWSPSRKFTDNNGEDCLKHSAGHSSVKLFKYPNLEIDRSLMQKQQAEREFEEDWSIYLKKRQDEVKGGQKEKEKREEEEEEKKAKTEDKGEQQNDERGSSNSPPVNTTFPKINILSQDMHDTNEPFHSIISSKKGVEKGSNSHDVSEKKNELSQYNQRQSSLADDFSDLLERIAQEKTIGECRPARLARSKLSSRIPHLKCSSYVEISHNAQPESLETLYARIKRGVQQGRLGLPNMTEDFYHFAIHCGKYEFPAEQSVIKDYAEILLKGLVHYPLQLELINAGITALLHMYNVSLHKSQLSSIYIEGFTTLLAVDEKLVQLRLIEGLVVVMDSSQSVSLNTDVVDLLLDTLSKFDDAKLAEHGLKVLCLGCVGHRKKDQYNLFLQCFEKWRTEWRILVHGCLAIDAFAQRAKIELYRTRSRARVSSGSYSQAVESNDINNNRTLPAEPIAWMPNNGTDIDCIIDAMKLHSKNRKLIGAGCTALASLACVSELHMKSLLHHDIKLFIQFTETHRSSHCTALGVARMIGSLVSYCPTESSIVCDSTVKCLTDMITEHKTSTTLVAECSFSLSRLGEKQIGLSRNHFTQSLLIGMLSLANENLSNKEFSIGFTSFLETLSRINENTIFTQSEAPNLLSYLSQLANIHQTDKRIVFNICKILTNMITKHPVTKNHLDKVKILDPLLAAMRNAKGDFDFVLDSVKTLNLCSRSGVQFLKGLKEEHINQLGMVYDTAKIAKRDDACREISRYLTYIKGKSRQLEFQLSSTLCQDTFERCNKQ